VSVTILSLAGIAFLILNPHDPLAKAYCLNNIFKRMLNLSGANTTDL